MNREAPHSRISRIVIKVRLGIGICLRWTGAEPAQLAERPLVKEKRPALDDERAVRDHL
jgi:hypothetical protein